MIVSDFTKSILFITALSLLVSCSALSTKEKIYRDMAIGAAVGLLIGSNQSESREAYMTMYAGIGSSAGALISTSLNVEDSSSFTKQNEILRKQIKTLEEAQKPKLFQKGNSLFNNPLPKEVASLVAPGEWRRYKLDQWVQDPNDSNTWYRQVEMFEIVPPSSK